MASINLKNKFETKKAPIENIYQDTYANLFNIDFESFTNKKYTFLNIENFSIYEHNLKIVDLIEDYKEGLFSISNIRHVRDLENERIEFKNDYKTNAQHTLRRQINSRVELSFYIENTLRQNYNIIIRDYTFEYELDLVIQQRDLINTGLYTLSVHFNKKEEFIEIALTKDGVTRRFFLKIIKDERGTLTFQNGSQNKIGILDRTTDDFITINNLSFSRLTFENRNDLLNTINPPIISIINSDNFKDLSFLFSDLRVYLEDQDTNIYTTVKENLRLVEKQNRDISGNNLISYNFSLLENFNAAEVDFLLPSLTHIYMAFRTDLRVQDKLVLNFKNIRQTINTNLKLNEYVNTDNFNSIFFTRRGYKHLLITLDDVNEIYRSQITDNVDGQNPPLDIDLENWIDIDDISSKPLPALLTDIQFR